TVQSRPRGQRTVSTPRPRRESVTGATTLAPRTRSPPPPGPADPSSPPEPPSPPAGFGVPVGGTDGAGAGAGPGALRTPNGSSSIEGRNVANPLKLARAKWTPGSP